MKLQLAEINDLKYVNDLYNSVKNTPYCVWDEYYPTLIDIECDFTANTLYLIKEDKLILGAVSINPENEMDDLNCFTKVLKPCEIARVVVNPLYQNKKIGQFMINELINEVKKIGYNSIRLAVEINHIPAIKLYEKCGFKKVGTNFMYEHHYYLYEFVF